jgi:excisionase family DNA binding protein
MNAYTDPRWVTVSQYARKYDVHETTVRRWIRQGQLPALRLGPRSIRIDAAAVPAYAA